MPAGVPHGGLLALLLLLSALLAGAARGEGFAVHDVDLRVADGVYQMDARVDLVLSDAVTEALESGVTLTVVFETDVVRKRRYMWDETVADVEARYAIEYHALSAQYVLRDLELDLARSYRRLAALIEDLGRIRDFPLVSRQRLDPDGNYAVRVRARLDIESLPAPMRPVAYLNSLWHLDSEWYEWPLPR